MRHVTLHSLGWLVVANGVGLLLATLLLFPRLGDLIAPFSYGRLMPLHMDLQLYGWCSLPLVGLLLRVYVPEELERAARLALGAWSMSLVVGAFSWLGGGASGKLFLSWAGPARVVFTLAMAILAAALAIGFAHQLRREGAGGTLAAKGTFLLLLLAVPGVMYASASPAVYPPINPASGGATGASLLGSTLGIIAIFLLCPLALGLKPQDGGRAALQTGALLLLHFGLFLWLGNGDRSHHEPLQIASLGSLVIWWPLLVRHLRRFRWPAESRRWLGAFAGWGVLLLATGVVAFLPGVLERWKFTNALVAHAHVAMAGLVSSFLVLVLNALNQGSPLRQLFSGRGTFWLWQGGCLLMVGSLLVLGGLEGEDPGLLFRANLAVETLYALRWVGGLGMTGASASWLWGAVS